MLVPALPPAPAWYPGHMSRFARILPAFLARTDIVIELRDARLPLTSINPAFEGAIDRWMHQRRGVGPAGAAYSSALCERIVVLGKKDLVGPWGIEPFRKAMLARFPDQRIYVTSHTQARSVKELSNALVSLAARHAAQTNAQEVNVLVVGMPNVGKSTLLNALRTSGIPGPTPKALRTSAHPGLTRALSTRLKLSLDPLIYAFDSPGVMMPFLGRGPRGAERGVKLALIAGIKEGLYDIEALATYLVYRLWVLNPSSPAYMTLLPPAIPPPSDPHTFLDSLAARLGMLQRGGARDVRRAAVWFVGWWRSAAGGRLCAQPAAEGARRAGWGFDFEWDTVGADEGGRSEGGGGDGGGAAAGGVGGDAAFVQAQMEARIEAHAREWEEEREGGSDVSATQERKRVREAKVAKRRARMERRGKAG